MSRAFVVSPTLVGNAASLAKMRARGRVREVHRYSGHASCQNKRRASRVPCLRPQRQCILAGRYDIQVSPLKRPVIVTVLAVLQFVGTAIWLLAALVAAATVVTSDSGQAEAALAGLLLGSLGALQLTCGIGLWRLRPYGRTLQLVFAWIGLIGIPFGTIISILILVYLFKPGIKALFSGKPATELTADELAQIATVSQGTLAAAILVLLVVFISIAALGVVAAIAIPGLLRARMAGNEASAIGSLRAIEAAQATFASSCGNGFYAPTLASLAIPPPGRQVGFLSSEIARDPVVSSGYTITLTAGDAAPNGPVACNGATVVATYFASAVPERVGATGTRFFGTNQTGTIFESISVIPVTQLGAPDGATPIR